jgi:hypothetical protein
MADTPEKKKTLSVVPENDTFKKRRKAFSKVLRSEEGQIFWAYLHEVMGADRPVLRISRVTGDLAPLSTEAAAALRDTYTEMRRIPERELMLAAETLAEAPPPKPQEEKK